MLQVKVILRGREKPLRRAVRTKKRTVEELLTEIDINPLEVLVKLNGEFVPDNQRLKSGDRLELLEITSRG